jgi:hypothetical protein
VRAPHPFRPVNHYQQNKERPMAATQNFQKAKLLIHGSAEKELPVLFNPNEYQVDFKTQYQSTPLPGTEQFVTQFRGTDPSELKVSLFFSTEALRTPESAGTATDVTAATNAFIKLLYVDASLHHPPDVTFSWGTVNFTGVVTQANTRFTQFEKDGMPTRAMIDLTIKETMNLANGQRKTPLESPDRTKCVTMTQGTTLWMLAAKEYGSPDMWRLIAKANHIVDPLHIPNGTVLTLPAI